MSAGLVPILVLFVMGATWGLQFAMLKLAVEEGYHELNILLLALTLISVIYGVMVVAMRRLFSIDRERIVFFVVIALIGYVIPMGATLYAADHVPAGILTLLASLAPLFTFAVAIIFRTEPVSGLRIVAVVLGCVSVALVLAPQAELPGEGALWWMVLALLIPLCYGVESIYVASRWPSGLDVMQVGFGEAVVAMLLTAPLVWWFGDPSTLSMSGTTADLAIGIFVLCGVFEVYMYFYLIRTTGGVLVSFGTFIALFAGIAWGMLLFAESHDGFVWLAVGIACCALSLVTYDHMQRSSGQ